MCYILKIVDDTGFENLVEPVNVSSEPSDHSPPHNEGKNAYYYAVTIFLTHKLQWYTVYQFILAVKYFCKNAPKFLSQRNIFVNDPHGCV